MISGSFRIFSKTLVTKNNVSRLGRAVHIIQNEIFEIHWEIIFEICEIPAVSLIITRIINFGRKEIFTILE